MTEYGISKLHPNISDPIQSELKHWVREYRGWGGVKTHKGKRVKLELYGYRENDHTGFLRFEISEKDHKRFT